jgi:putative ABC transport system permease protein
MKFFEFIENIKIAFDAMRSNKLRSLLASLGVVIGISFVIIMGWILEGLDTVAEDTFNSMGEDMLHIHKFDWSGGMSWKLARQRKDITYEQYLDFKDRMKSAEIVMPNLSTWGGVTLKYGNETYQGISIFGTTYENAMTPSGKILEGRHFNQFEDEYGANVILLGYGVYNTIFPNGNALGKTIKMNGHKMEVIGVIEKRGGMFLDFLDNQCFIPYKKYQSVFGKHGRSVSIAIKAGSKDRLDYIRDETIGIMRTVRNLQPGEENDFSINESKVFEEQSKTIRFSVWAIGIGMTILSFIVGLIGIMNIMFVSVTERTKEIGIRKAIGAKKRSIRMQFITESATLCFIGAIISFIFTAPLIYATATIVPKFFSQASFLSPVIPYNLLIIATIVSIVVGILAGLIPAIRAANLDPVEAIRTD